VTRPAAGLGPAEPRDGAGSAGTSPFSGARGGGAPAGTSAAERGRRTLRAAALAVALTATLVLLCCTGGVAGFFLTEPADRQAATSFGCGGSGPVDANGDLPRINPYGDAQIRNAAIIINVGADLSVPPRGWVIAVATAMQESVLSNLPHLGPRNDHDSVGLFQQRPSQGWGTPAELQDPVYASRKFYEKLLTVPGWQNMPLTDAAQQVQRSAFPDAYAKHELLATQIVNLLADGAARAVGGAAWAAVGAGGLRCAGGGEVAASGWTAPVQALVVSAFRTSDRPGHNGVDLGASRHTAIHAAAAGRVLVARCDADDAPPWSCDSDGSPATPGCGWYVDLLHAGNVVTRYCHMVSRPQVVVGQLVSAGQVIGLVGTSGHSSGPHLHFEVHLGGDRSSNGAIDPVPFMRERGAPLGTNA
jgi:murein DD-endopeptidase MepM/ murein hydrolase activator NlpD